MNATDRRLEIAVLRQWLVENPPAGGRSLKCEGGTYHVTGEPMAFSTPHDPRNEAAQRLADRARRLRALANDVDDLDLREFAGELLTAAHSGQPGRKLAADLGLALNKLRPTQVARYAAIRTLAKRGRYNGKNGKPLADAIVRDLATYFTGTWGYEESLDANPHPVSSWRHDAWAVLKATPMAWVNDAQPPVGWRTVHRALNEKND